MLELCTHYNSNLGRDDVRGDCEVTRVTEKVDLLSDDGFQFARDAARRPATHLMISLPCTGGSPLTYVHRYIEGGRSGSESIGENS